MSGVAPTAGARSRRTRPGTRLLAGRDRMATTAAGRRGGGDHCGPVATAWRGGGDRCGPTATAHDRWRPDIRKSCPIRRLLPPPSGRGGLRAVAVACERSLRARERSLSARRVVAIATPGGHGRRVRPTVDRQRRPGCGRPGCGRPVSDGRAAVSLADPDDPDECSAGCAGRQIAGIRTSGRRAARTRATRVTSQLVRCDVSQKGSETLGTLHKCHYAECTELHLASYCITCARPNGSSRCRRGLNSLVSPRGASFSIRNPR